MTRAADIAIPNPHSWEFKEKIPPEAFVASVQNQHGELLVVVGEGDQLKLYHGDMEYDPYPVCDGLVGMILDATERNWLMATWFLWREWRRSFGSVSST